MVRVPPFLRRAAPAVRRSAPGGGRSRATKVTRKPRLGSYSAVRRRARAAPAQTPARGGRAFAAACDCPDTHAAHRPLRAVLERARARRVFTAVRATPRPSGPLHIVETARAAPRIPASRPGLWCLSWPSPDTMRVPFAPAALPLRRPRRPAPPAPRSSSRPRPLLGHAAPPRARRAVPRPPAALPPPVAPAARRPDDSRRAPPPARAAHSRLSPCCARSSSSRAPRSAALCR